MSSIFPLRDTITRDEPEEPRLVDLDEETADEVFEALAASTTRKIFLSLHEQPQTASDLAELTDTSVQNVQYHLQKLQDADLISVVDTWYSERGSEMEVYAPDDESLVLYAGRDKQRSFRSLLNRLVGVGSFLLPSSIIAGWAASRSSGGGETVTGVGEEFDADESVTYAGGDAEEDSEEQSSVEAQDEVEEDDVAGQEAEEDEDTEAAADDDVDDADADGAEISLDGDTREFAANDADTTVWQYEDGNLTAVSDDAVVRTAEGQRYLVDSSQADSQILVTDGGNVTMVPEDVMLTTAESTAGVDPGLAAALAFFCGGLVVLAAMWAWYGTPE